MSSTLANLKARRWIWIVWSARGPSGPAKRAILQVLYDFLQSSPEGKVFPSEETIADKVGIAPRNLRGHMAELEASGWLKRSVRNRGGGQGWRRYQYQLHFPPTIDVDKDEWLNGVETNRIAARDAYRQEQDWQPANEEEARRWGVSL